MKYYIAVNNERKGPFEESELIENGLTQDTLVWCKGMDEWKPAKDVRALDYLFANPSGQEPENQWGNQPQQHYNMPWAPYNWLGPAIVVTILCCSVLGIIAIIKAVSSSFLYKEGHYEEAQRAASQARNWVLAAVVVGIAYMIFQYAYLSHMAPNLLNQFGGF